MQPTLNDSIKRVYCLYKVSTIGQVDKNDIPLQKNSCREFAKHQPCWVIQKEFQEKGVSGFKVSADDRDAIQELKTAAENNEFDILLVFMFDRIGRIDNETPFVVEWFIKHGIAVWSVNESMRLLTAGSLVRVQLGEPKEYSLSTVGVDDVGGPPVPIPNTEVKPCSAENTWLATARENRKMPTSDSEYFLCKTALRFYEPYSCVLLCVYGMEDYKGRACCTASSFLLLKKQKEFSYHTLLDYCITDVLR